MKKICGKYTPIGFTLNDAFTFIKDNKKCYSFFKGFLITEDFNVVKAFVEKIYQYGRLSWCDDYNAAKLERIGFEELINELFGSTLAKYSSYKFKGSIEFGNDDFIEVEVVYNPGGKNSYISSNGYKIKYGNGGYRKQSSNVYEMDFVNYLNKSINDNTEYHTAYKKEFDRAIEKLEEHTKFNSKNKFVAIYNGNNPNLKRNVVVTEDNFYFYCPIENKKKVIEDSFGNRGYSIFDKDKISVDIGYRVADIIIEQDKEIYYISLKRKSTKIATIGMTHAFRYWENYQPMFKKLGINIDTLTTGLNIYKGNIDKKKFNSTKTITINKNKKAIEALNNIIFYSLGDNYHYIELFHGNYKYIKANKDDYFFTHGIIEYCNKNKKCTVIKLYKDSIQIGEIKFVDTQRDGNLNAMEVYVY